MAFLQVKVSLEIWDSWINPVSHPNCTANRGEVGITSYIFEIFETLNEASIVTSIFVSDNKILVRNFRKIPILALWVVDKKKANQAVNNSSNRTKKEVILDLLVKVAKKDLSTDLLIVMKV